MEKIKTDLRILHAAALLRPSSGMCTQMAWELEAAEKLGIEWQVKMYCPKNSPGGYRVMHYDESIDSKNLQNSFSKFFGWIKLRFNYHQWLMQQEDEVDIYILRYYVHDPFQYFFVKRCKKPIYFVHHTLEVPELQLAGGIAGWVRASLEDFIGKKTLQLSNGVIGVTQEIIDYEMSRINTLEKENYVYPNGILYKQLTLKDRRGDIPELLFLANFSPWHGLDRLLHAIKKSDEDFVLHLVGKVPNELKDQITDPRIKLHGHLNQNQIVELSEQCWIGLASFALDRNKMKQACPLKSREYLMLGLPVYGDYQDIFPDDFIYFKKGNEEISMILDFSRAVRSCTKVDISTNSHSFIDKISLLSVIYNKI
jgi:glycosyltransferase involved in cell wall biosynthesis